jgi:hypothetical protein
MERAQAIRVKKAYETGDVASLDMPKPPKLGAAKHTQAGSRELVQALTALDAQEEAARYGDKFWTLDLRALLSWTATVLRALGVEPVLGDSGEDERS